ncbi:hypothetical protein QG37_02868 [Candidozyma auris]|uniref:Uncharacterized protein n=1 Tax=Candidozyma auris TaxID=498019 RepID=A0A0L0P206_CANAR|nr:hypothetical protein QG37_02868 [[Candida] auris]
MAIRCVEKTKYEWKGGQEGEILDLLWGYVYGAVWRQVEQ